jgi:K+-transporting ATPase ATPase A chain
MSDLGPALGQIGVLLVGLAISVPLLGRHLAHVYTSDRHLAAERATYRVLRVDPDADQHWRTYRLKGQRRPRAVQLPTPSPCGGRRARPRPR